MNRPPLFKNPPAYRYVSTHDRLNTKIRKILKATGSKVSLLQSEKNNAVAKQFVFRSETNCELWKARAMIRALKIVKEFKKGNK